MRYKDSKKPVFNAGYINDLNSFTDFLAGDVLHNNKTVYLECNPDLMPIIRKKFDSMSIQLCFSIKDSGRKNLNFYFLLDNINERALNRCLNPFSEIIELDEQKKFIDEMIPSKTSGAIPKKLRFDARKSVVESEIGNLPIPLNSSEYSFCKAIFKHPKNKQVPWDKLYEEMTGDDPYLDNAKKCKKKMRDTKDRINEKLKKRFSIKDNLLSFERNYIKRNF